MRIAYFVSNRTVFPGNPNEITASSTVVANIIKHMSLKHEVTLYASKGSVVPTNVTLVDLGLKPFEIDSNVEENDWRTKTVLGMKQIYIGEILKNSEKFDLINLHTEPVYLAMPYAELAHCPILFTSHNAYHDVEESIFTYFEKKIFLSGLSKRQVSRMPFSHQPSVIYNGIEVEKFNFEVNAEPYFFFLGRLHSDKGIDIFLEVARQLPDKMFYIAGRGSSAIEEHIRNLEKSQKNIKFFGMVPRMSPKWFSLLSKAKALLAPILYEDSCPLVTLESMACGTPVIGFPKGALPEQIVHTKTGLITSESTVESLIQAILTISSLSENDYTNLRKQSRSHVENNFTTEKMAYEYEKLYQKVIDQYKLGHVS